MGRVRSLDRIIIRKDGVKMSIRGKMLEPNLNGDGYESIKLCKDNKHKTVRIHRLVAEAFIPNPWNLATVNHIDYNRANNNVENLEWLSQKDNVRYSSDEGRYNLHRQGEDNGRAMLTEEDVINIRKLHRQGVRTYKIAKMYNRGWTTIDHVVKRTTWKHIA